jgi:hypothetical protein
MSKAFRFGPIALTNAAANLLNPGTTTGGVNCTASPYNNLQITLTQLIVTDKSGVGGNVTLYIGATGASAAGTEWLWKGTSVTANGNLIWNGRMPLYTADFLVGLANANTTLTIEGAGLLDVA